jgi:Raf kinase inhibitor-like YbhB/YbcL family protein
LSGNADLINSRPGKEGTCAVHTKPKLLVWSIAIACGFVAVLSVCVRRTQGASAMSLVLRSEAFQSGGEIPAKHTCQGDDTSPPLSWSDVPPGAKSFALIVDDPDAPDPRAPKMTWVHWVLFNIPSSATGLAQGAGNTPGALPAGTADGTNDWKKTGYGGPCPPIGRHRYFFKLYALDTVIADLSRPTKAALERAMAGHIVGKTELLGTYEKRKGPGR